MQTLKQKMAGFFMKKDKAFFIKLSGKDYFLHYEGENEEGKDVYRAKEGTTGAAMWGRKEGEAFLKSFGIPNLELVEVNVKMKGGKSL